jgi:methyl-accepting chemotaxis protein
MKSRLSSTIWTLVFLNMVALLSAVALGFAAGAYAGNLQLMDALHPASSSGARLLIGVIIALLLPLFVLIILKNKVLRPLKHVTRLSEGLATGDYHARINVESGNEFDVIAANLNHTGEQMLLASATQETREVLERGAAGLVEVLNEVSSGDMTRRATATDVALTSLVDCFNQTLDSLCKMLERGRRLATDVALGTNTLLAAATEVSASAGEQEREIATATSVMDDLTDSIKQLSIAAEAGAEAATRSIAAAEHGTAPVRKALDGLERIRASLESSNQKFRSLADCSRELSRVVDIVHKISEQVTSIALNAAVAAARAGESGRAFADIAEQIRALAEQSRAATKDIAALIKALQVETQHTINASEPALREADASASAVEEAAIAMEGTFKTVEDSAETVQQMSLTARLPIRPAEAFANSLQMISTLNRQTSQRARHTARNIEQVLRAAEQLQQALAQFRTSASPTVLRPELAASATQR